MSDASQCLCTISSGQLALRSQSHHKPKLPMIRSGRQGSA